MWEALWGDGVMSLSLAQEIRLGMTGSSAIERMERAHRLLAQRGGDLTVTLAISEPDILIRRLINQVITGRRYDENTETDVVSEPPIHLAIHLASLQKICPLCATGACGRVDQFHDITYKTGLKAVDARGIRQLKLEGRRLMNVKLCKVNKDSGAFLSPVSPDEAIKILRQLGENIVVPRFRDRDKRTGDRWLVRDLAHHARYGAGAETWGEESIELSTACG